MSPQPLPSDWYLTAEERGNDATTLDSRHAGGRPWTEGNEVRYLVHGATYFAELHRAVMAMGRGDLLLFTDWRGDPDQRLREDEAQVGSVFAAAAGRGVDVRGLVWRSHLDRLQFSAAENRHLGSEIEDAGGQCLLDMRVRPLGSHHQKFVVLRHPGQPDRDVAFVGGIDLCHSRRDDAAHRGDPQRQKMAKVYGSRPPWHDVQLAIRGPAVGDVETVFRERWQDPAPLSRNPIHLAGEVMHRQQRRNLTLPLQLPDPPAQGHSSVQLLRTYPSRLSRYPFAPHGERSVALGYTKAVGRARSLIFLEDQYLWSADVAEVFARALIREPELRLIALIPRFPDQDGQMSFAPNLAGRVPVLRMLAAAGGDRVAIYCLENAESTPIYIHAKVCVIDDTWACVGSDNANRRSWTHDSELSAAVIDAASGGSGGFALALRLHLMREHLGLGEDRASAELLSDPVAAFDAFARSAAELDRWHLSDKSAPRPPGQLRAYRQPTLSRWTTAWSTPLYRVLYDPDGRTRRMRRAHQY